MNIAAATTAFCAMTSLAKERELFFSIWWISRTTLSIFTTKAAMWFSSHWQVRAQSWNSKASLDVFFIIPSRDNVCGWQASELTTLYDVSCTIQQTFQNSPSHTQFSSTSSSQISAEATCFESLFSRQILWVFMKFTSDLGLWFGRDLHSIHKLMLIVYEKWQKSENGHKLIANMRRKKNFVCKRHQMISERWEGWYFIFNFLRSTTASRWESFGRVFVPCLRVFYQLITSSNDDITRVSASQKGESFINSNHFFPNLRKAIARRGWSENKTFK